MQPFQHLSITAISLMSFLGHANAWLVQFWDTQGVCALDHADTERGGLACQENCSLLGLEDVRAIRISDWDDGCTVGLWPLDSYGCTSGEPVWELSKEDAEANGELVDGNWSCQRNLDGMGVVFVSYFCKHEDE
ncbi:hypothetical protein GGR58DRAFT_489540 [Xylaria digitata]|nr:hypothetical protein GGR58DRAFT_489540 [Xylaria digitata]